jgi:hypothetical protein
VTNDTVVALRQPGEFEDLLTDVLRQGAHELLAQAVEVEVADFLAAYADLTTEDGRPRLVLDGHLPERIIQTGIGPVDVQQPSVRDGGMARRSAFRRRSCRAMRDDRRAWTP